MCSAEREKWFPIFQLPFELSISFWSSSLATATAMAWNCTYGSRGARVSARPSVCNLHQCYAIRISCFFFVRKKDLGHVRKNPSVGGETSAGSCSTWFSYVFAHSIHVTMSISRTNCVLHARCRTICDFTFTFFSGNFLLAHQLVWPLIGCVPTDFTHNSVRTRSIATTVFLLLLSFFL